MTEIPKAARAKARRIVNAYTTAEEQRNAKLRALRDEYELEQKDIIEITGYTRETVRFALMPPDQWRAAKEERRKRRPKPCQRAAACSRDGSAPEGRRRVPTTGPPHT